MTNTMYIGSGDVNALMAAKDSLSHIALMQRFVSGVKPHYNAKASPIDALRTGAILEDRYLLSLSSEYYAQYPVTCKEMDVFRCTLDFAKISDGEIVDFEELKSMYFLDFLNMQGLKSAPNEKNVQLIKKAYKAYYYQIQQQLLCTGLNEATLTFLVVNSYDDQENMSRDIIQQNDTIKIRIPRDEDTILQIKERGNIFQQIRDYYHGIRA